MISLRLRFPACLLRRRCAALLTQSRCQFDAEDASEDELVRMLVQDATSSPLQERRAGSSADVAAKSDSGNSAEAAAKPGISMQGGTAIISAAQAEPQQQEEVTYVRQWSKRFESFVRIRREVFVPLDAASGGPNSSAPLESSVEWMCCHCRTFNFPGRKTCRRCNSGAEASFRKSFPPTRHVATFPVQWICEQCGTCNDSSGGSTGGSNTDTGVSASSPSPFSLLRKLRPDINSPAQSRSKFYCRGCAAPFEGVREWYCPTCSHINSRAAVQCATCFTDQPFHWICKACKNSEGNSIFTVVCRHCQAKRERKVSDATVLCDGCGARNDVRWEMCESCMRPLEAMDTVRAALGDEGSGASGKRDRRWARGGVTSVPPQLPTCGVGGSNADDVVVVAAARSTVDALQGPVSNAEEVEGTTMITAAQLSSVDTSEPSTNSIYAGGGGEVSGAWWCSQCNVLQRRNAQFCDVCLQPRSTVRQPTERPADGTEEDKGSSMATTTTSDSVAAAAAKGAGDSSDALQPHYIPNPSDWQCPYCRQYRVVTQVKCCDHLREVPSGYWLCSVCSSTNRNDRQCCLGCGAAPQPLQWTCTVCSSTNSADAFECDKCGSPHPLLWRCPKCNLRVHAAVRECTDCGTTRPPSSPSVKCPVCRAPNVATRRACFRCHARLCLDEWACAMCGSTNARTDARCQSCTAPREFDMTEQTWVCEMCAMPVASGGALPERSTCPRCDCERSEGCVIFPSRWKCSECGLCSRIYASTCPECGTARWVEGLHTHVDCAHCFRRTVLDSTEKCEHCGEELASTLTEASSNVSILSLGRESLDSLERMAQVNTEEDVKSSASALYQ